MNIYQLIFDVGDHGNGFAIVAACNPKEASNLLLSQGRFKPLGYKIYGITLLGPTPKYSLPEIVSEGIIIGENYGKPVFTIENGHLFVTMEENSNIQYSLEDDNRLYAYINQ